MSLAHPRSRRLMAWYDGELSDEGVARHVGTCARCWRRVESFATVDRVLRAGPAPAPEPRPAAAAVPPPASPGSSWMRGLGRVVVPVAVVVAVLLAALGAATTVRLGPTRAARMLAPGNVVADGGAPASTTSSIPRTAPLATPSAGTATGPQPTVPPSVAPTTPGGPPEGSARPLHLALPIPGGDAGSSDDDRAVVGAARSAVAAANASGGVAGRDVVLDVIDADAAAALPADVDALVGGQGVAGPAVPWLLAADGGVDPTVSAVLAPDVAGTVLADAQVAAGRTTVGVIVGQGRDATFADGLAARMTASRVPASSSSCDREVTTVRARRVRLLAIAGDSSLVRRCIDAAARSGWPLPVVLVPPSVALEPTLGFPATVNVETVLGLPWPTWSEPGPTRFRQATRSTSYRALITFSAVELAVDVARTTGAVTPAGISGREWRNDLYAFSGAADVGLRVVDATPGGWSPHR